MNTKGVTKIQTVVYEVMNDLNQVSMTDYKRFLQWAIRGYKKLNIFYLNTKEVFVSKVTEINTVSLPDDYISYSKIGFLLGNEIHTLSRNDSILTLFRESEGKEVVGDDMLASQSTPIGTWLAVPNKTYNIGFYKEDKKNNRLIFQGDLRGLDIVVEYISTGIKLDGQTYIPEITREPLIAYIHWQRVLNGGGTLNEAAYRERIYTDMVDLTLGADYSITPDEFLDALTSGYSQLPG